MKQEKPLTHADVVLTAVTPDVVGHFKPATKAVTQ